MSAIVLMHLTLPKTFVDCLQSAVAGYHLSEVSRTRTAQYNLENVDVVQGPDPSPVYVALPE